jgi:hypothetical protein
LHARVSYLVGGNRSFALAKIPLPRNYAAVGIRFLLYLSALSLEKFLQRWAEVALRAQTTAQLHQGVSFIVIE